MSQLFAAVLRARMSALYLARIDVARALGVSPKLVAQWATAAALPATEDLPGLARVLGLPQSYVINLVGPTQSLTSTPPPLSSLERAARDHWLELRLLPPAFRQAVLAAQLHANSVESSDH